VVLTVAEALAWYLIHPYDERNLYLYYILYYQNKIKIRL
jgi:hypothetical protein